MKKIKYYFLIFVFSSCTICKNEISSTEKIKSLFYSHLNNAKTDDFEKSLIYLENLTKINSEAGGDWARSNNPTILDLARWEEWFLRNQSKLKWNQKAKNIYL
jgi:hypothetical protein